jgi:hypothetical protein
MIRKSIKKLFVGFAVFSAASICAHSDTLTTSQNFFQPRAFSANLAREMLMEGSKHKDSDSWCGKFSATGAYQRSWSQNMETSDDVKLADTVNGLGVHPFWSGLNVMTTGPNDGLSNLDAYQFGLGPITTTGSITLNPIVYQAGADLMLIFASSGNKPSFFAKIKAPLGVYNINPNLTEVDLTFVPYDEGALSATSTSTTYQPATTITQAFAGNLAGGQVTQGDFVPMQFGLINGDQSTSVKFADVEMTIGYRFVTNDEKSFSLAIRASAPTGGQATAQYMMEPIFGRGGNWGLGGYADGHVTLWQGNNENNLQVKFIANAMHLFSTDTMRSYDLIDNGGGSKYVLVANYKNGSYQGTIANLINYSTLASTSLFSIEGDAALSVTYMQRGWSLDVGYEFWGRSAETLEITGDFSNRTYAVLGRQGVATSTLGTNNLCEPTATIAISSPYIDTNTPSDTVVSALVTNNRIALTDLNVEGAQQTAALTSKVFSKITYEWIDSAYCPHAGIMGEFEISMSDNNALPQWGVSLVGGISF